jgi:glycosyltransferase involved in cell wall biosynthesis
MIGQAIGSVLKQDYVPIEHIIIDGGSTDGTLDLLAQFPHLKVVSGPDKGMYDALNKGLKLAQGEIVGFLNTDDLYAPDVLKEVAPYFGNPEVEAVVGRAEVFRAGKDGNPEIVLELTPPGPENLLVETVLGSPIFNAWFFRRSMFERIGVFNTGYRIIGDREFMIRLALAGIIYAKTDTLVYRYCEHAGSLTFNREKPFLAEIVQESLKMTDGFLRKAGVPGKARQSFKKMRTRDTVKMAIFHSFKREAGKAWFYACEGMRYDWSWPGKFAYEFSYRLAYPIYKKRNSHA